MAAKTYSEREVEERLKAELPTWRLEDGWIRRTYKTQGWKGTLMVINTVGHLAEAAFHHPDITASYACQGHHRFGLRPCEEDRGRGHVAAWQGGRTATGNAGRSALCLYQIRKVGRLGRRWFDLSARLGNLPPGHRKR